MKERLHYIDIMKGITMLTVVLHHVLWITVDVKEVTNDTMLFLHGWQDVLASFIMPAFFFCTGYCSSFDKPFKTFFISNFKSLLFPSITIGIAYEILYGRIFQLPATLNMAMHQGFLFFWFLYALFYGKMIFWLLDKFVKNTYAMLSILLFLAFIGTACNDINFLGWNFMQYRQTFNLTLYLGIGYYFKNFLYQDRMLEIGSLLFVAGVMFSRIVPFEVPKVTAGFDCTFVEEPLHVFYALTGTQFVMFLSKMINRCIYLEEVGKKSLVIYVIHNTIILRSTEYFFYNILQKTDGVLITLIVVLILVVLATASSYLICMILNTKYLKWTLGKF